MSTEQNSQDSVCVCGNEWTVVREWQDFKCLHSREFMGMGDDKQLRKGRKGTLEHREMKIYFHTNAFYKNGGKC